MSDPYAQQPGWQQPQPSNDAPGPAYPAAPQGYPGAQGYPPAQQYPPAQPYTQPYPAAQPYATAQPYPAAQPYAPAGYPAVAAAQPERSGAMGVIALLGTVLATVGGVVAVAMMAAGIEQFAFTAQSGGSSSYAEQQLLQQQLSVPSLILSVVSLIGFACWVVSIVATATNRGRVAGIIGIILGVLAPIGVGTYFFVALYQTIQHFQ